MLIHLLQKKKLNLLHNTMKGRIYLIKDILHGFNSLILKSMVKNYSNIFKILPLLTLSISVQHGMTLLVMTISTPVLHGMNVSTPVLHAMTVLTPVLHVMAALTPVLHVMTVLTPVLHVMTILTPVLNVMTVSSPVPHVMAVLTPALHLIFIHCPVVIQILKVIIHYLLILKQLLKSHLV